MAHRDDVRKQDFLIEMTDAVLSGDQDALHQLTLRYDVSADEVIAFDDLIRRLEMAYDEAVVPTAAFKRDLKTELLGSPSPSTLLERLRNLPPRLQIAAGIALLAAMTLLGRRRLGAEFTRLLQQWRTVSAQRDSAEVKVSAQ